jgi:hypothetical protein
MTDTKNERGRGRSTRQPQAEPEVLRPNFGQHNPAIGELQRLLADATRIRGIRQKYVAEARERLQDDERQLADYSRKIESYSSAIRTLGGEVPGDEVSF